MKRKHQIVKPARNWFCAQMGARAHYIYPRALHSRGALGGLITDYWSGAPSRKLAEIFPLRTLKSIAGRFHPEIPDELVSSWNVRAMLWETRSRQMMLSSDAADRYLAYCDVGQRFSTAVSRHIESSGGLPDHSIFFGYDTCSLEIMQFLKDRRVPCILDQIDACRFDTEMVEEEQMLWPEWENYRISIPEKYYRRREEEWKIADKIIVNSAFTRNALLLQDVPIAKIEVVPLSFEPFELTNKTSIWASENVKEFTNKNPLRVLFLGQVSLRKGIQYLIKAAELLHRDPVVFDVVGSVEIAKKAVEIAPHNVSFWGKVARSEVDKWYLQSHLFVLPTISDGFALTQLEAMAFGLPVIATPNCGEVVSDGVDGFLVPVRDAESIACSIRKYLEDPNSLIAHHLAALNKSRMFSVERLADSLLWIEKSVSFR